MKLTEPQRQYLRESRTGGVMFYDMVLGFISRFNVTPEALGALLAQWIRESV